METFQFFLKNDRIFVSFPPRIQFCLPGRDIDCPKESYFHWYYFCIFSYLHLFIPNGTFEIPMDFFVPIQKVNYRHQLFVVLKYLYPKDDGIYLQSEEKSDVEIIPFPRKFENSLHYREVFHKIRCTTAFWEVLHAYMQISSSSELTYDNLAPKNREIRRYSQLCDNRFTSIRDK